MEAKNDDLTRGFTQLAVELIALAQVQESEILYGAVTIGDAWRFGKLDAVRKQITQDITLLTVPDDLGRVMGILVGILEGREPGQLGKGMSAEKLDSISVGLRTSCPE